LDLTRHAADLLCAVPNPLRVCVCRLLPHRGYQDPKTSRWLWNIRERARQKRRTENYRKIIAMQENDNSEPPKNSCNKRLIFMNLRGAILNNNLVNAFKKIDLEASARVLVKAKRLCASSKKK
jgi:hypothetical protein